MTSTDRQSAAALQEAINEEVAEARARLHRSGWNVWALAVAIASLSWIGLDVWEQTQFSVIAVMLLTVVFISAVRATAQLIWLFAPVRHRARSRHFHPAALRIPGALALSYRFLEAFLSYFILVFLFLLGYPFWLLWSLVPIHVVQAMLAASGLGILLSNISIPLPSEAPKRLVRWVIGLPAVLALAGVVGVIPTYLTWQPPGSSLIELKMSLLITVGLLVVDRLAVELTPHPIVGRLIDLRRRVRFDEISEETAWLDLKLLIQGSTAGAVLESRVTDFSAQVDRFADAGERLVRTFEQIGAVIDDLPSAKEIFAEAEARAQEGNMPSATSLLQRANERISQVSEQMDEPFEDSKAAFEAASDIGIEILFRARLMGMLDPESVGDMRESMEIMSERIDKMREAEEIARERSLEIRRKGREHVEALREEVDAMIEKTRYSV